MQGRRFPTNSAFLTWFISAVCTHTSRVEFHESILCVSCLTTERCTLLGMFFNFVFKSFERWIFSSLEPDSSVRTIAVVPDEPILSKKRLVCSSTAFGITIDERMAGGRLRRVSGLKRIERYSR